MKLTEAMRKGAKIVPQTHKGNMFVIENGKVVAACAVGHALIGQVGNRKRKDANPYTLAAQKFPVLKDKIPGKIKELSNNYAYNTLFEAIYMLNDSEGLTTEQIADILEKEEY